MLERMWRNRNTFTLLVGVQISSTIVEDSVGFLKDLEIENSFDPAIPLMDMYPKDYKSFCYQDTCTHMFIVNTVYNSKHLEPTQMPIDDRLDKEYVAHIHHVILCSHKK